RRTDAARLHDQPLRVWNPLRPLPGRRGVVDDEGIGGFANSTLSRLSRAVARLERRQWVTRGPDPDDGRTTIATLTESGLAATRAAAPGHVALVRRLVFDSLTPAQARALGSASRRITSAIADEGGWRPQ